MWWPASPPRRDRPFEAGHHAAYLAHSRQDIVDGIV
jgi:hypothetical protein